ncbi:TDT family transporter [Clostridium sp. Sa3CUN1]|uniref:TDT family transporter n=1 Tax=Clostridium gallinarum TaxID=2762246 RepID=A0ABR8PZW2_9CLOT|nr:TDT family transporter [Clostridium gallinarum]MBD7913700.1 TDT family transporter [Clostridium gallinarum]
MNKNLLKKTENIPVPLLPTMVGAATLSNIYSSLGYSWIRHITMWIATGVLLVYLVKIFSFTDTCKKEYSNTVPSSLYAGFTMITMILGSYYFEYNNFVGKSLWGIGLGLHAIHILIFTYRNVIKGINKDTFVPSWFVTYNGIMVSVVVGASMKEPFINKIVLYYGILVLILIMPFMIIRLIKLPLKDALYHTQAILLAPSSLCVVCYLNIVENPNKFVIYPLYLVVFITLLFVVYKLPGFFSFKFTPAFAGLTFPMAIGILASMKMATFVSNSGYEGFGNVIKQISGIQLYITTAIISFVMFNFFKLFLNAVKNK